MEWLRQQRNLAAAEQEAEASEAIVRAIAVEPLSQPLVIRPVVHEPFPPLKRTELRCADCRTQPPVCARRMRKPNGSGSSFPWRTGPASPILAHGFSTERVDKEATGFSVGVKVPLWNANRGEIARAEANGLDLERRGRAAAYRARDRGADPGSRNLQVAGVQATLLSREILPAARAAWTWSGFSFEEGETSLLDLLDAQRTFRESQREAAEAHLALSMALGEVQRLAGPDFNPWR